MKTLFELFNIVNRGIHFETVGEDVSYAFKQEEEVLYIYFEPSNGDIDWKHNFSFWKQPYKDMEIPYYVHGGFLKCWKYVEDIVIERIKDETVKEIVVVGYSHGAALAMLCHECCWFHREDIRNNIWGIGFDGPRVFAGFIIPDELQKRWVRFLMIRNHNDIVTHVPPILFGYRHVGIVAKIGKDLDINCIESHYPVHIRTALKQSGELNTNWKEYIENFYY